MRAFESKNPDISSSERTKSVMEQVRITQELCYLNQCN